MGSEVQAITTVDRVSRGEGKSTATAAILRALARLAMPLCCASTLLAPSLATAQECGGSSNTGVCRNRTQMTVTSFANSGVFNNGASATPGTLTVHSGGTFANSRSFYNNNTGTLQISNGATFENTASVYTAGNLNNFGLINNSGRFFAEFDPNAVGNNSGVINNNLAGHFWLKSGIFNNAGVFNNNSGSSFENSYGVFSNSGTFNNNAGAYFSIPYVTFKNSGIFNSLGRIEVSSGGASANGAILNLEGGTMNIGAGTSIGTLYWLYVALSNAGLLNIGYGGGNLATTTLYGNFAQTSTGSLAIRADWATGTSDKLAVNGTATLAGTLVVTPLNFPNTGGLTKTFDGVVTATGGITNNGLTVANTAAVTYVLLHPDSNTIDLQATINFQGIATGGLTPNQTATGGALNQIFGGGTTLGFMTPLMQLGSQSQLAAALNQLAPSSGGASAFSTLNATSAFASQLLSCRTVGEGDVNAVIREGQCLWARGTVRHASGGSNADGQGFSENAAFYSAGAQFSLGGPWRIGTGIGYETPRLRTDAGAASNFERVHLGAVLKYNPGSLLLAATVTGGFGWSDNSRIADFGGFTAMATSKSTSDFLSGRLTAAYLMPFGGAYLKPQVELANTRLTRDGYTESGSGGIALAVAGSTIDVWSFTSTLELGTELKLPGGGVARPFVRGGATFRDKDAFSTSASFVDAPGSSPFTTIGRVDRVTADIATGVDLISKADSALRVQYDGQFGNTTTQHSGSVKFSIKY